MKKFGFLIASLVLLFSPISAIAGIGDAYNCKVIDGATLSRGELQLIDDEERSLSSSKFVWLKESIVIKGFSDDLVIPIESQKDDYIETIFEAYDGTNKLTFRDGFLIRSIQGTGNLKTFSSLKTYDYKKF